MLDIVFHPEAATHDDLELRLGAFCHQASSHDFRLTRSLAPGDESPIKVQRVLSRLWKLARRAIVHLSQDESCFVPFDLSDQCTGWIRFQRTSRLAVTFGWSNLPGHDIDPASPTAVVNEVAQFNPVTDPVLYDHESGVLTREIDRFVARFSGRKIQLPCHDPTPIFEHFRGSYGSELLTAAVCHFNIFEQLREEPLALKELAEALGLCERPARVLTTALSAMGLLQRDKETDRFVLSALAEEHLVPETEFDIGHYLGLAADAPGVLEMVERLKSNRPAGGADEEAGTAFIYRAGQASAMEAADLARHFTLSLAGRAKNVAPHLAAALDLDGAAHLLDVGGGTGIYAIACLLQNPELTATVLDRPQVLSVAEEFRRQYGVEDRLQLLAGDMFADELPTADVILLSNILHDWDLPECRKLIRRCMESLTAGGRLLIHDVFLNDAQDGPLPIALYSAALFTLTEGRAYSAAEYREWLEAEGLEVTGPDPTLIHCGIMEGRKA